MTMKMSAWNGRLALAASVLILAACSSEAPSASAVSKAALGSCAPFAGNATVVAGQTGDGICTYCVSSDEQNAADGDLNTFASQTTYESVGVGSYLRATAQPGVVYAPGLAAVVFEIEKIASAEVQYRGVLRSYLAGEIQDEREFDEPNQLEFAGTGGYTLQALILEAHKPFDTLELAIEGSVSGNQTVKVYEFCSAAS